METMIKTLVERYDSGSLTLSELVQHLTLLASGATGIEAVPSEEGEVQALSIDHVSLQVSDVQRSAEFLRKTFNLPSLDENENVAHLKVGQQMIVLRQAEPYGVVDHIAIGVPPFDKARVTEHLKQLGVTALDTASPLTFHVVEPSGFPVQIVPFRRR